MVIETLNEKRQNLEKLEKFNRAQCRNSVHSLSKSASVPSVPAIAPAVVLGLAPGGNAGSSHLLEGTLYVARAASSNGPAAWEPYRFAHHIDGCISFRPLKHSTGDGGLSFGRLSGVLRSASEEFFLDADWRQPFVAAPWKPVTHPKLADASIGNAKDPSGRELFPFTLSYAPARPKAGDTAGDVGSSRRRTVVLAAPNARLRGKWMTTFARKAYSPELRNEAPVSAPGTSVGPSSRRVAALGEEHVGLPVTTGRGTSVPRLVAGPPSLFDSHSSMRIVRDLYDGYAADPLSQNSRGQQRSSTDSDSSGAGTPTGASSKEHKSKFLARYLDRQAEIEHLLDHKWSGGSNQSTTGSLPSSGRRAPATGGGLDDMYMQPSAARFVAPADTVQDGAGMACEFEEEAEFPKAVQFADKTSNVTLEGDIVTNTEWSGGAIFAPPDERSFHLTVCPIGALEEQPIFLGIAPPDADLSLPMFFSSGGGVFLCTGGSPSDDLISALGAPGGPCFFSFGDRIFSTLPNPKPGQSISVHYTESEHGGQLRFFITSEDGQQVMSDRPPIKGLPPGPWRPCLLLCMPDTRVRIVRLT